MKKLINLLNYLLTYWLAVATLDVANHYLVFPIHIIIPPTSVGRGHYKNDERCLSVTVACLDLTREQKGTGSPKLAEWKPITRATKIHI